MSLLAWIYYNCKTGFNSSTLDECNQYATTRRNKARIKSKNKTFKTSFYKKIIKLILFSKPKVLILNSTNAQFTKNGI